MITHLIDDNGRYLDVSSADALQDSPRCGITRMQARLIEGKHAKTRATVVRDGDLYHSTSAFSVATTTTATAQTMRGREGLVTHGSSGSIIRIRKIVLVSECMQVLNMKYIIDDE